MAAGMEFTLNFKKLEMDDILRRKARFEGKFKEMWDANKLDGMLCPAYPHSAFKHVDGGVLGLLAYYTALFNVLGYPAGTVPVTEVLPGEDTPDNYQDPRNDIYT